MAADERGGFAASIAKLTELVDDTLSASLPWVERTQKRHNRSFDRAAAMPCDH